MFFTIDPYYPSTFYNECLEALKNNKINYNEFISVKSPYNWFLNVDRYPIMLNYDIPTKQDNKFLVSKVIPLKEGERYLLQRRNDDTSTGILKYIENQPFTESRLSEYSVFFRFGSKEELIKITKEFPDKIWFLGKYFNNTINVALCNNIMIKNYLKPDQILLEKKPEHKNPGYFEADFNFKILKQKDFIKKYTETTFVQNGIIAKPKLNNQDFTKTNIY